MDINALEEIEALQKEAIDEKENDVNEETIVEETVAIKEPIEEIVAPIVETEKPIIEEKEVIEEEKIEEETLTDTFEQITVESSNGQKIDINSMEELITFAKKGATVITPNKVNTDVENFIEQANLTQNDLQLLADAKSGDKQALEVMASQFGVDVLDLVENSNYNPKFQVNQPTDIDIAIDAVLANPAQTEKFRNMTQFAPEEFINSITTDVNKFNAFINHTNSGLAEYAIPLAQKAVMMNGGSFEQAYMHFGNEFMNKQNIQPTEGRKPEQERVMSSEEKKLRDRASLGTGNTSNKSTQTDIFDMSDDEFADWKETAQV